MKKLITLIFLCLGLQAYAQEYLTDISVHDPVMIKEGDTYYLFSTGWGINIWSSTNKKSWKKEPAVFDKAPAWAVTAIPGFKGHIWAPDIFFSQGQYYLYYSVSAFGKNTSAIGVATNKTLDPVAPGYKWVDHGKLIQSYPGKTNWNAIDPNVLTDQKGTPWMVFGSFWDGIKLVKLKKDLLHTDGDLQPIPTIASRKTRPGSANPPAVDGNPVDAGGNAIEAPFLFKKEQFYYLFASVDYCCKAEKSTYKMIVGRAKAIQGPYYDQAGVNMAKGGGTLLLEGDANWYGVGHNAVATFEGSDYLIFHGYDAKNKGIPKLRIEQLKWANGWPVVAL
jgi:arabinan endo-1,5-alpha-L-arabinosidase